MPPFPRKPQRISLESLADSPKVTIWQLTGRLLADYLFILFLAQAEGFQDIFFVGRIFA